MILKELINLAKKISDNNSLTAKDIASAINLIAENYPTAATTSTAGPVKQAAAVADAASAPTKAEFNALLASLRAAGIIATPPAG